LTPATAGPHVDPAEAHGDGSLWLLRLRFTTRSERIALRDADYWAKKYGGVHRHCVASRYQVFNAEQCGWQGRLPYPASSATAKGAVMNRLLMCFLVLFTACGGDGGGTPERNLVALTVTPPSPSVPKGLTQQFVAVGTFSDSSREDLLNGVAWSSGAPAVATVNASGLASALSEGSSVIKATYPTGNGYLTASVNLSVTPATLREIAITPNPAFSGVALTLKLTATGIYTDATRIEVSALAIWSSDTPWVVTVDPTTGLTTGVSLGSGMISAAIGSITGATPLAIVANVWSPTGGLSKGRSGHTGTLLPNGSVLVVGGCCIGETSASAELYDFAARTWSSTGRLDVLPFWGGTATLLPNGKVLVVGGVNTDKRPIYFGLGDLYDPATGMWSPTGRLGTPRYGATATLLASGKVLVAGGQGAPVNDQMPETGVLASAELYDPAAGTWSPTGSLLTVRAGHTATLLPNGKVLVIGGGTSAELYDPDAGIWSTTGSLSEIRSGHTATLLSNGKVLVVGGYHRPEDLATAELYDPATGTWSLTGILSVGRSNHTATVLSSGEVLVAGGGNAFGTHSSAEVYDPVAGTWAITSSLSIGRLGHSATLLANGTILVSGGVSNDGSYTPSAELYW
jgi:N-acetylneuraminic acid mutarotase